MWRFLFGLKRFSGREPGVLDYEGVAIGTNLGSCHLSSPESPSSGSSLTFPEGHYLDPYTKYTPYLPLEIIDFQSQSTPLENHPTDWSTR